MFKIEKDQEVTAVVKRYVQEIGIDLIGCADPSHFERYPSEHRPFHFLKDAQTAIVIGMHLYDPILDTWSRDPRTGRNFHFLDAILENLGRKVKTFLTGKGFKTFLLPYSPGLFLKDAGALAGIGPIGKNNLLISKEYGPQIRLRALVTNAPLKTGTPIRESTYCKDCNKCIQACPADALTDGNYNKAACLQYNQNNLQHLSDHSVLWCNECIEACPVGTLQKE